MTENIQVRRCTCDICKRKEDVTGNCPNPLVSLILPVDYYDECGKYLHISIQEIEVCKGCLGDINRIISEHYSMRLIKYGGVKINKKEGVSNA